MNASVEKEAGRDFNDLLLPLGDRIGALQKANNLIAELNHPNIDWKYAVDGIRSYLFDFFHDIEPYSDRVIPILLHFLEDATARGRSSSLRACDTYLDRYSFVLRETGFPNLGLAFSAHFPGYLDLLTAESGKGLYLSGVNGRLMDTGSLYERSGLSGRDEYGKLVSLLISQYELYIGRSIITTESELRELGGTPELTGLLSDVSAESYSGRLREIRALADAGRGDFFAAASGLVDFSHNARCWERACAYVRKAFEEGNISGDPVIMGILSYLVRKSNEGGDRDLQMHISRTAAAACSIFSSNTDVLRGIIDLVMPALLAEIDRGGNYFSAFSTIYNIGKTVVGSGKKTIIDYFVDFLVKSKFCFPEFSGIAQDWSVIVNSSHLENIRTWMKLIELNPTLMKRLASSLIVNLKLGGVFLKDTDVFQRDVSRLLNSDYSDVFYLVISLAAVFPAFYHDIGATGDIRSYTERIDTNHKMDDLIHFLRKQVHVESSSRTVYLFQRVMEFWLTGDSGLLEGMVPQEVFERLDGFFEMMNLDSDPAARAVLDGARSVFEELSGLSFWDFLDRVDGGAFLEAARRLEPAGIGPGEKERALRHFAGYFESRNPAEMTKMLACMKNRFGIDASGRDMWKRLYEIPDDEFRGLFEDVKGEEFSRVNVEKFITFLHVYRMLFDKYNFSEVRGVEKLESYAAENLFEPGAGFFEALRKGGAFESLDALLSLQDSLKSGVLLGGKTFEPLDTIEFKRHIAFGIPSMYGSYKEKKFDTLKVFFHTNLIIVGLFERSYASLGIMKGGPVDYAETAGFIRLFFRKFLIDGLMNQEMVTVISLLETPNLRISQFRDIVNHLLGIHGEISDRFNETFKDVCREAIKNIGIERISRRFLPDESESSVDVVVDRFLRDQIMQTPLLQLFDNLLIRLKERLATELAMRGDGVCLNPVSGPPARGGIAFRIGKTPAAGVAAPVWETGGKAYGLLFASEIEGIRIPEGFILSSGLYKRVKDGNLKNPRFRERMMGLLRKEIPLFTGNRFGNMDNPVLLSVRSGAVFSMPGVMDTITNVGITKDIIDFYAERDPWFAYDCYRRLIQDLAISSYGMDRSIFEKLMSQAKEEAGVALKEELTSGQMEILTRKYRYAINSHGFSVPEDPYEQLFEAILSVYRSWESPIARNFRDFVNISGEWGTAVIVQRMIFGNYSPSDITGVVYSQNLGNENIGLFGEYKTRAQGHDIVSGVARVFPVSEEQKRVYAKSRAFPSMEKNFPGLYSALYDAVRRIREGWRNDVEIEFTIENNNLYILQIRGMTRHTFEIEELESNRDELHYCLLGQGLAASGGVVSGRAVFGIGRIDFFRERFRDEKIVLVRPETTPEEVIGIKKSDGILTCVGGMTSHAVLQMRRFEKSGVSDFSAMKIDESRNSATVRKEFFEKDHVVINEGDYITIDGNTGNVYLGYHKTKKKITQ
ncbi:MAG: PEP-utilizing enzyme [Spirochaetes bacterium]|jgi:phosphohistidine swiveling domain-containing protein|nr:PEP-utilizing enzyme [Spirochaetota bacterium]